MGAHVSAWSHVQVFSPWRYNIDPVAGVHAQGRRLEGARPRRAADWRRARRRVPPPPRRTPADRAPPAAGHARPRGRPGRLRQDEDGRARRGALRAARPLQRRRGDAARAGRHRRVRARMRSPNPLGANGLPAIGEAECRRARLLRHPRRRRASTAPATLGAPSWSWAAGTPRSTRSLDLADLAAAEPGTTITWAVRRSDIGAMYGGGEADALPARGSLGARLRPLVESGRVRLVTGFLTRELRRRRRRA